LKKEEMRDGGLEAEGANFGRLGERIKNGRFREISRDSDGIGIDLEMKDARHPH
jgi:hypothetical protein